MNQNFSVKKFIQITEEAQTPIHIPLEINNECYVITQQDVRTVEDTRFLTYRKLMPNGELKPLLADNVNENLLVTSKLRSLLESSNLTHLQNTFNNISNPSRSQAQQVQSSMQCGCSQPAFTNITNPPPQQDQSSIMMQCGHSQSAFTNLSNPPPHQAQSSNMMQCSCSRSVPMEVDFGNDFNLENEESIDAEEQQSNWECNLSTSAPSQFQFPLTCSNGTSTTELKSQQRDNETCCTCENFLKHNRRVQYNISTNTQSYPSILRHPYETTQSISDQEQLKQKIYNNVSTNTQEQPQSVLTQTEGTTSAMEQLKQKKLNQFLYTTM